MSNNYPHSRPRRYDAQLSSIRNALRPHQVEAAEEGRRQRLLRELVDCGHDEQKALMALELVDYQSAAAAVDVLRRASESAARPAITCTPLGANVITIPQFSPQPSALPAGGRVVCIPVAGSNESCSSRSNSPAASPDVFAQRRPPSNLQQAMTHLSLNVGAGVSQVNTRHRIVCGDIDDMDQPSPQSSTTSSKSQDLQQMIQRVQRVLQKEFPANQPQAYESQSTVAAPTSAPLSEIDTPTRTASPNSTIEGARCCVSPLPSDLLNTPADKWEPQIQHCNSRAFRFYMEQHIENVLKQHREREERRSFLERDMIKANFEENFRRQLRNILAHKETMYLRKSRERLDESMFEKIKKIGVGAFGKVVLVRRKDTQTPKYYAMKILQKRDVIALDQAAHVKAERDILAEANCEWIVKLYCCFQNSTSLFFIMEYIPGGDLMALLIREEIFSEEWARFYTAELVCAIESVHRLGFIHRDIKPDNILIDRQGHIKLTDFGLCTGLRWTHDKKYYNGHVREDSFDLLKHQQRRAANGGPKLLEHRRQVRKRAAHSLVGTSNYMAPEVLTATGHDQRCDWWSVGVILYEMVVGRPPFYDDDPCETQRKVIQWQEYLYIPPERRLSAGVTDLILQLCTDKEHRIGGRDDACEIKAHPWLAELDFDNIRQLPAPYVPTIMHETDTNNFDAVDSADEDDLVEQQRTDEAVRKADKMLAKLTGFGRRHRHNGSRRNGSPAFYDFTFRHFFDVEPMESPSRQQRPSLAPLIEASQRQALASSAQLAHPSRQPWPQRQPPPPYNETNNNLMKPTAGAPLIESHALLMARGQPYAMNNNLYTPQTYTDTDYDYV